MEQQHAADDQSHYEISLTAGQAFVAFVLLLLSLAASFAFGLMLGKGQADERLVVRKETPVVTEASLARNKSDGRIVELGVPVDDFEETASDESAPATDSAAVETPVVEPTTAASEPQAEAAKVVEGSPRVIEAETPRVTEASPAPAVRPAETPARTVEKTPAPSDPAVVHYAQLLSTHDQKTAETLAVRLINGGFKSAYVERGSTDKGPVYRVRVRFPSESEARGAESKLRAYSKDVWITAK
jgi:cell division septation protein DedD